MINFRDLQFIQHLLSSLRHLAGNIADEHDPQGVLNSLSGTGHRFPVVPQGLIHGLLPRRLVIQLFGTGRQPDEQEIQRRIIDDVVAFLIQLTVDVAQQRVITSLSILICRMRQSCWIV